MLRAMIGGGDSRDASFREQCDQSLAALWRRPIFAAPRQHIIFGMVISCRAHEETMAIFADI